MLQYVLVDLDDTLCAAWNRADLIDEGWDVFHSRAISDEPIEEMINLINGMHLAGFIVIGLTSRPSRWRTITHYWLITKGAKLDHVLMRNDSDYRSSAEVKMSLATDFFGDIEEIKRNVAFIMDDREDVVKAFAGIGVTTLHVNAARRS